MAQHDRAHATLEPGHKVLPQYLGMHASVIDPRPNPRMRRGVSEEDDPAKAEYIEKLKEKYRRND